MNGQSEWRLSSSDGTVSHYLPYTMVFLGRTGCDINVQGETIDKRHALVTFDHYQNKFKVKDLGTANGTYVNDRRIPEQTFITVEEGDSIQLGREHDVLFVSRCAVPMATNGGSQGQERFQMSTSQSLDRIKATASANSLDNVFIAVSTNSPVLTHNSASSSNPSVDDLSQGHSRSSSRPLWDRRPNIAECQGCIKEQELHHSCGINSELDLEPQNTEEGVRASPVSPVLMSEQKHETQSNGGVEQTVTARHSDLGAKRGTPLYGQPSWWGETGADEHNKKLLKDMQKQLEEGKQQQKELEEDRMLVTLVNSNPPAAVSAVETGGDNSKSLSFTVNLADSLEEKSPEVGSSAPVSSGDKLSNFMPENLRKSFRERRGRLNLSAEKGSHEGSPILSRRSKSPPKVVSSVKSSSVEKTRGSFLINKMFDESKELARQDVDEQTEYSLYSEAKVLNRCSWMSMGQNVPQASAGSSTMPELQPAHEGSRRQISKSRTADSLALEEETDAVSESGTYTIEEDNQELLQARQDIDKLFNVQLSVASPELEIRETEAAETGSVVVEIGSSQTHRDTIEHTEQADDLTSLQKISPELTASSSPLDNNIDMLAGETQSKGSDAEELRLSREMMLGKSSTMPKRKKEVQHSKEKILQQLGIGDTPVIEKERPKLVEELLTTRTYHRDNDPIIVNKTTFFDKIISSTSLPSPEQCKEPTLQPTSTHKERTVGRDSIDSVNTDVLLQSTDEFMKAIHSFSSESGASQPTPNRSSSSKANPSTKSNTLRKSATLDRRSSNGRMSNGGEEVTPRTKESSRRSVASSVSARLSGARKSSRDSDNEGSAENLSKSSSNRVGPLSSSRPNRTFELRRARTESIESESSAVSTSRTNGVKTGRSARSLDPSEVSLGARIVQRSRESGAVIDNSKSAPIKRNDGGRYSLRASSTTNKASGTKACTSSRPASGKKAGSRPSSNSMIAKAEREREAGKEKEKAAWDRRRTYDPRRAVQEKVPGKRNVDQQRSRVKSYPQCSRRPKKEAFDMSLPNVQAKAKKSDNSGDTPNSSDEPSARPRANSYSGENATRPIDASKVNEAVDVRHSADVFPPTDSELLKLNLQQEIEDNSHELEIAQLSHNLAKDLEIMSTADGELPTKRKPSGSREKIGDPSPDTQELIESMFACQQKSAFSSYRSVASATPETASPALSPMKKKLSTSQNFENGSSTNIDHSYNDLVLTSIQRLSTKLHGHTSSTVSRLRDRGLSVSASPSPTEELKADDMPANTTLAAILKTLKLVEHNCKVMEKALFTSSLPQSEISTVSNNEHEHYLAEIKRIRNEIAGFRPIDDSTGGAKDSKPSAKTTSKLSINNNNATSKSLATKTRTGGSGNVGSYKQRPVYY